MKGVPLWRAVLLSLVGLLVACGNIAPPISEGGGGPACEAADPLRTPRASIFPAFPRVPPGSATTFTIVSAPGGGLLQNLQATWSVDGGDAFGKITNPNPSSTAQYQAPAVVPTPNTAIVRARLVPPNETVCATATVTIQ